MANKDNKNGGLVEFKNEFAVANMDLNNLKRILAENLGADQVTPFDLETIRIPSGRSTTWEVPRLGGTESTKELDGVIVYWKPARVYWAQSFEEGGAGNPPDCVSDDGLSGEGNPGGICAKCPFNEFGSGGYGKACKEMRQLFFLPKGNQVLPNRLVIPPSSLKPIRQYFLGLASEQVRYLGAVTRFTLKTVKSKGGIDYPQVVPSSLQVLANEELQQMDKYASSIRPVLDNVKVSGEDYYTEEG